MGAGAVSTRGSSIEVGQCGVVWRIADKFTHIYLHFLLKFHYSETAFFLQVNLVTKCCQVSLLRKLMFHPLWEGGGAGAGPGSRHRALPAGVWLEGRGAASGLSEVCILILLAGHRTEEEYGWSETPLSL